MKLLRYGRSGEEKPGLLDKDGMVRDISSLVNDINPQILEEADICDKLKSYNIGSLPVVNRGERIGSPVGSVGKVICIGFNSKLHTEQLGFKPIAKDDIVVFLKPSSAICGPNDPIFYSRMAKKIDWEAELGVVIGKKGKYIEKVSATEYILGYTCINDLSDRYWQFETDDKQYTKGKGFDTFSPIGPYIVTKDEIKDPGDLDVKLWVNDELRQDFNTSDYIHDPEEVVSYLSRFFTLFPGDVIAMGSAPGNARFWGEDKFLKPGDKVIFEIESLGRQEKVVVSE